MKLSVIVPVYNVEDYLEECVNSIINQTYKNIEIILVDDGSTDNSGKICDKFKKQDKRIKVIHKKNGGLSSARNEGLKASSGEYIMFIDSDDYLGNNDVLKDIFDNNKKEFDVIQYNMKFYYDKSKKYVDFSHLKEVESNNPKEVLYDLVESNQLSIAACDKIVKTKIIKDNNIYFELGLISEDIEWSLNLYFYIKSIKVIDKPYYVYRQQRVGSLTSKRNKNRSSSLLKIIKKWFYYDYKDNDYKNIYSNYLAYQYSIVRTISRNSYFSKEDKELIKKLDKEIFEYDLSYKVKLVNKFRKIFGLKITILIMKIYLFMKNIGLMKI